MARSYARSFHKSLTAVLLAANLTACRAADGPATAPLAPSPSALTVTSSEYWNAELDFSATANPNGAWSAGWKSLADGPGSSLQLYAQRNFDSYYELQEWSKWEGGGVPHFAKNMASEPRFGALPGQVSLHPGVEEYSALRFTAPRGGLYQVSANFMDGYIGHVSAHVVQNNPSSSVLFTLPDAVGDAWFTSRLVMRAGDALDFMVGPGEDGHTGDTTPIGVYISRSEFYFEGFLAPVDNGGTYNRMKAGGAVPIRFTLAPNLGTNLFIPNFPASTAVPCPAAAPVDAVEEFAPTGASTLAYVANTGAYTYVWRTSAAWAGTCRKFVLGLDDGSTHEALFQFTK
jgi:hypothetical protein